jgi:hypothetical protein
VFKCLKDQNIQNWKFFLWVKNLVAHIKGSVQENRPRVFKNRVLRKIPGSDSGDVTGEWRKLLEKELLDLYCSPDIL